jgi:Fic/DOC family
MSPFSHLQLLDHLEAFERYLSGDDLDALAQVAVVHAHFELLHPFKDGNGRIGLRGAGGARRGGSSREREGARPPEQVPALSFRPTATHQALLETAQILT